MLVVDDVSQIRVMLKVVLECKLGVRVIKAASSRYALKLAGRRRIDLVISDLARPGDMGGLKFLGALRKMRCKVPVLIFSGSITQEHPHLMHRLGPCSFLPKGGSGHSLLETVASMLPPQTPSLTGADASRNHSKRL